MSITRSLAAAAVAVAVLVGTTTAADAAPKAKAKIVKKAPVRKAVAADPCSPAEVAKVPGVLPGKPAGLVYVTTRTGADYKPATSEPRRWVNYRGPEVWLSTVVCGTRYTHVYAYADGSTSPRF